MFCCGKGIKITARKIPDGDPKYRFFDLLTQNRKLGLFKVSKKVRKIPEFAVNTCIFLKVMTYFDTKCTPLRPFV